MKSSTKITLITLGVIFAAILGLGIPLTVIYVKKSKKLPKNLNDLIPKSTKKVVF
jgi:adenine/guanine phosphoribosyltransferase-like PRPP-binding protein